jgi:NPCBM/NEW2 domain
MTQLFALLTLAVGHAPRTDFEIRTVTGEARHAEVQRLKDGSITLKDGESIAGKEWYALHRASAALPDWPCVPHVELVNGDRFVGTVTGSDGDKLRLRLAIPGPMQEITIPLSALRVAWLVRRPESEPKWLDGPRSRDVLQSRNGDLLHGSLTAIDLSRGSITYQTDGKDRFLDLAKVAAIGFNTDLARNRRPKGSFYRATLVDGSRISATALAFDGKNWKLETLFRDTVTLPEDQLIAIDVEQGPALYLSGLRPANYSYHSFDGEQHPWAPDRSATGEAIRLKSAAGESTFDRGIGLRSDCTITYSLDGKFRRLESTAGLDSRSGVKGDVLLSIAVDGKEKSLPGGGRVNIATSPIDLRIDLTGAKELTISVRRANGANVQNHLNLAEARLVRAE